MTIRDHMTLALAARPYRHEARRVEAARVELGMSETRYAQVVNALIDRPDAEATYPMLVHRLRRLRTARRAARRAA